MMDTNISRRELLMSAASATALAALPHPSFADNEPNPQPETPDQKRRLAWWHQAKFGRGVGV